MGKASKGERDAKKSWLVTTHGEAIFTTMVICNGVTSDRLARRASGFVPARVARRATGPCNTSGGLGG